jgi:uncharacterized protein (TIGR03083 family)
VHDLVAHLTGLAVDFSGGVTSAMTPGFWDHGEVDRREIEPRRERALGDVLDEWTAVTPAFEAVLADAGDGLSGAIVGDFVCHEHDIRFATRRAGGRDSEFVAVSLDVYTGTLAGRIAGARLRALRVEANSRSWLLGSGDAVAVVRGEPFELFRALTGRRTRAEVRAFEWTVDAEPYVDIFPMYDWPASSLQED